MTCGGHHSAKNYKCCCDKKNGLRCGCHNDCGCDSQSYGHSQSYGGYGYGHGGYGGYGKQFCKCGCKVCEKPCKFGSCGPGLRLNNKCISTYRLFKDIERNSTLKCCH